MGAVAGANKANSFLAANAVEFGSTAGSAALLARANENPIKTVYLFSRPEWTALVVGKDSPLTSVRDLKGKKIAATRGTDPWFFLLRSLRANGLDAGDVEIVELQHPDGRAALERGQVDAWAGLDPHMAASQLEAGSSPNSASLRRAVRCGRTWGQASSALRSASARRSLQGSRSVRWWARRVWPSG